MRPIARACLFKFADFLDRFVPFSHFSMGDFGTEQTRKVCEQYLLTGRYCGTACCAAGWLVAVYGRELGLEYTTNSVIRYTGSIRPPYKFGTDQRYDVNRPDTLLSLALALGLSYSDSQWLFLPGSYPERAKTSWRVDPRTVAARIRTTLWLSSAWSHSKHRRWRR